MDGLVEPSMPTLPSVINAMKETGAPTNAPPQQNYYNYNEKRKSNDSADDFAGITTDVKRLTFGSGGRKTAVDDLGKQMSKTMFGKMTLSARQKEDIAEAFNAFDVTGTGYMSTTDLRVALKALGFEARKNEMRKLLDEYDTGNTGRLCYSDFMNIIEHKLGENDTREDLLKVFKLFDKYGVGTVCFENLREVATELNEDVNDEEIAEMIAEADLNDDGSLDDEEFLKILKNTSLY